MHAFKNTLIHCGGCRQMVMVKASDRERGEITCKHPGCGYVNKLLTQSYYDPSITAGLPSFGQLIYTESATPVVYPLQFGLNVIGLSTECTVVVDRFMHQGKCFISRRHCTLDVSFDKWTGLLRYRLQDGTTDPVTRQHRGSLNGTFLAGTALRENEQIDVPYGGIIRLGGADSFRLEAYIIPKIMLETYQITAFSDPDSTQ
ncbi:FHA domain-containing protein [Tellurirhabdus bombi]|uniref:FHA domain-containing protein n=1 Tax=Tellurirhabdus bombi TaxID=2907205 RepID=UPI001F24C666|nr:FHA domain-containing protein [Tellurirhabdus bombi]